MAEHAIDVPNGMRVGLPFALMRPVGTVRDDVPELLRLLADTLEELPTDYELDALVFERLSVLEDDEDGLPRITAYVSSVA